MAGQPSGPWRVVPDAAPGQLRVGPYTGRSACFRAFADLYYALARAGQDVAAARRLELWQIAAILGVDYEREPAEQEQEQVPSRGRGPSRLLRERVAWQRGEGPRPEVQPSGGPPAGSFRPSRS